MSRRVAPAHAPWLRMPSDGEWLDEPTDVARTICTLTGRPVVAGTLGGRTCAAELTPGPVVWVPLPLEDEDEAIAHPGRHLAVFDPRGAHVMGFWTTVRSVALHRGRYRAELEPPTRAFCHSGRVDVRLRHALGASIEVDDGFQRMPAHAVDLSSGGIGIEVSRLMGAVDVDDSLTIYLQFDDCLIELPARVRHVTDQDPVQRLGAEFVRYSEELARRVEAALPRPMPPPPRSFGLTLDRTPAP